MPVMHDDGRARPMQRAGDRRAQPASGSGDECDAAVEPRVMLHDGYPSVRRPRLRSGRRYRTSSWLSRNGGATMSSAAPLPELRADELAHSQRLTVADSRELAANRGWMPFSRYMQMALYEPGLGYYSAGALKLGAAGDSSPHRKLRPSSGAVSRSNAPKCCASLGGGDCSSSAPARARSRSRCSRSSTGSTCCPEQLLHLDVSAELRERQRATLVERVPALASRVVWLDTLPAACAE